MGCCTRDRKCLKPFASIKAPRMGITMVVGAYCFRRADYLPIAWPPSVGMPLLLPYCYISQELMNTCAS